VKRIGLIICDRYRTCAGGKCLRALRNREGAFCLYQGQEAELVGYATCNGCPGGNVEYAPEEMKRNGVDVIHLATGLLVGYPPCPHLDDLEALIRNKHAVEVVLGTHPIPQSYYDTHQRLGTWTSEAWKKKIEHVLTDETTRRAYD
jgi:predicted metal-binding protein